MEKIKDRIVKFLRLDNLVSNLTGYVETRLELYKIEIREDVGRTLAKAMVYAVMGFFFFLFLVFFSIGLAHFLNSFFQDVYVYAGYWIVAGIYAGAFLIVLIFREPLDKRIEKRFMGMTKRKEK
jgi:uncharacterized membrane protein YqjE